MNKSSIPFFVGVLTLATSFALAAPAKEPNKAPDGPSDPGWPREYSANGQKLIVHQPQVDSWDDYTKLHYRAVVALTPAGKKEVYGVAEGDADTEVDESSRTVAISRAGYKLRFPGSSDEDAAAYEKAVRAMAPESTAMVMSLDRVLAMLDSGKTALQPPVEVNLDPPRILYSAKPAVLVMFLGTPQMKPVEKEKPNLMFAANTNWDVFFDTIASKYYLLNKDTWLTATDPVKGPWAAADKLPVGLSKLPANENWSDVIKNIPGKKTKAIPAVFVTTEMIVTTGEPAYAPVKGTKLMKVSNTESTVFMNNADRQFYFLVAGRWFRAAALSGPWSAASSDLPPDFASIPDDSAAAVVKSSVAGTEEAKDAVMLASVPRTTAVKALDAKLEVTYAGEPKFEAIQGTNGVQYATNSANAVLLVSGGYYVCDKGAWYCGGAAKGPWAYCTKVPAEIYTIPSKHPLHNVTYVKVKSANGTTVVYTQTSGYSGEYVAANGVLMFGAGLLVGALIANNNDCDYCYPAPYYYSYGCGAHYHYGYGGYYGASHYYGPYGGAGRSAAYNPYTGTYSRGAYAYGPAGGGGGYRQAYNPYTDTYAARAVAKTPYGSSGRFYAERGNKSAWGGHESGARGTVGWAQNSEGGKAVGWDTARNQGVAVKGKNDNMFVANDGNIYKRNPDGGWSSPTGSTPNRPKSAQQPRSDAATRQTTTTAQRTTTTTAMQQNRVANSGSRAQATQTSARSLDRTTTSSLDSASRSRQRGNAQAQSVSQFQSKGFSGGSGGGRSSGRAARGGGGGRGR